MDILADCTDAQKQAITHMDGPLLVVASAGSGKTRVVTRRIGHLLDKGVPDENVLGITFTNKAAGEMSERVRTLVGHSRVMLSTFHSLCARLLRIYGPRVDIPSSFTIYDRDDSMRVIKEVHLRQKLDSTNWTPSRTFEAIARAKSAFLSAKDYAARASNFYEKTVQRVYADYENRLRSANAVDFDDLLIRTVMMLQQDADILGRLQERYRYVLVDEYQDTNHSQYLLTSLLARAHRNLCVTGDPDQSIYAWRGANISNILDFEKDYAEARVIKLEQNWRSTKSILAVASAVIRNNVDRKAKALWTDNEQGPPVGHLIAADERAEAEEIATRIDELIGDGTPPGEIALFYRTNALSRIYERRLRDRGVPYRIVAGTEFYQRREVKDIIAYLRLALNGADDVSFLRIVNVPTRGVGATTVAKLKDLAHQKKAPLMDVASAQIANGTILGNRPRANLKKFTETVAGIRATLEKGPCTAIRAILDATAYRKRLAKSGAKEELDRAANVDELVSAAAEFEESADEPTVERFLEQVALVSDVDGMDPQAQSVSLMTIHAAKGLEFDCVFIVAVEQGVLPHAGSLDSAAGIEEERRLCYVAMTRARKRLLLSQATWRMINGRTARQLRSQFISEIPPRLLERIDIEEDARDDLAFVGEHDAVAESPFLPGDSVRHAEYGLGEVVGVFGNAHNLRIAVTFGNLGTKRFVAGKAPLEKIRRSFNL